MEDMRNRLISGEYGDGSPVEKEEALNNRGADNEEDVEMKEDRKKKKKEESSSGDSDSDDDNDEDDSSSEEDEQKRKKSKKREHSTAEESRGRRRSTTDPERSDIDQRPSTSSGKRSANDDSKKRKKMKSQVEPPKPPTVTKVIHRLRLQGPEGIRKAHIIESKITLMVEDMENQKTIYVKDKNTDKFVNPKNDLPNLDISKVPKFYWSQKMRDYIKCGTYRKMKENELYDEIYDERTYGVTTPSSNK